MTVTIDDVHRAHERIAPHIHRTPVMTSATFDEQTGVHAFFKCENLQKIGAFKARGALNAVLSLSEDEARRGVVTHSSGNHGAALAWAAGIRGIPATVVMPHRASPVKVDAVAGYGAHVVRCAQDEREEVARTTRADSGATLIHPFEDARVIAGQATATLELLEDAGPLDAIVIPVGGGGLSSGGTIAAASLSPGTSVFGAEPTVADDAHASLAEGRRVPGRPDPPTIADGLLTGIGPTTYAILSTSGIEIVLVDDAEMIEACRFHLFRMKILVEPSGAIASAAVRKLADRLRGRRIGAILSGGNTDLGWLEGAR